MAYQTQTHNQTETRVHWAKTQLAPAVGLFFLAPLIGEFLLGNLPITWLWVLITLAPLYGGGALLIRETVRRLNLGWPSMVVLGLTYAVIEEAFVTQTLFNPDYLGLGLLDYGYISRLGIGAWWTVFVLTIHTIWSTSVPIALMESLTPETRRTPWLGPLGLTVTAILFGIGCVLVFTFQQQPELFIASPRQWLGSAGVVAILIGLALALGRSKSESRADTPAPPQPGVVGGIAFVLGSAFMGLAILVDVIPATLNVAGMVGLLSAGSVLFWNWSKRGGWSELHRLAVAGGLLLTYGWYGFVQVPSIGGVNPMIDAVGNLIFAAGALTLLIVAWRRAA